MKFSSLLWISLPLASAALDVRQSQDIPDVGCSDLCGIASLADSTKQPRCQLSDIACLCGDDGWTTSFAKCVADICPANAVEALYQTWSDQCATIGEPLKSKPSFTGTIPSPNPSLSELPGPDPSASALPSVVSAAKSILAEESDTQLASVSTALNGINPTASAPTTQSAGSSSAVSASSTVAATSSSPSVAPTSAGNMLLPPAGLWAGLLGLIFAL